MFEFLFSAIWLGVSAILIFVMAILGIWPGVIIMLLFASIGVFVLRSGIKKLKRNRATAKNGTLTYGIILDVVETNVYVNDKPELRANVIIVRDGLAHDSSETVGYDPYKYKQGQFIRCLYYNDDINILGTIDSQDIPRDIFIILRDEYNYRCGIDERSRQYFNELNKTRAINDNWDKDLKHDNKNDKSWEHVDSNYDW